MEPFSQFIFDIIKKWDAVVTQRKFFIKTKLSVMYAKRKTHLTSLFPEPEGMTLKGTCLKTIWVTVSVSDLNQNIGFGRTLMVTQRNPL